MRTCVSTEPIFDAPLDLAVHLDKNHNFPLMEFLPKKAASWIPHLEKEKLILKIHAWKMNPFPFWGQFLGHF